MVSRSNSLKPLRESAPAIFNLPTDYFASENIALRDKRPEIQQLIGHGYDDKGNPTYLRIAPVICCDGDTTDPSKYFLNPCLFKVNINLILSYQIIALIYGESDSPYSLIWENIDQ